MGTAEIQENDKCPSCGSPSYAGHTSDCPKRYPITEATSDDELREFYQLREINRGVPKDKTTYLERFANDRLKNYHDSQGNVRVFLMKDSGKIIGGAQMEIEDGEKKRAYLGMKFVDKDYRGKNLSSELVAKRLEAAKQAGCREAYSLVHRDNFPALRSIMKDGFDIRSTKGRAGMEDLEGEYYVSRNLAEEPQQNQINFSEIPQVTGADQLTSERVLINMDNTELIDSVLSQGFAGRVVVTEKELPGASAPMIYFEKVEKKGE